MGIRIETRVAPWVNFALFVGLVWCVLVRLVSGMDAAEGQVASVGRLIAKHGVKFKAVAL